jgi:hypothetical protein
LRAVKRPISAPLLGLGWFIARFWLFGDRLFGDRSFVLGFALLVFPLAKALSLRDAFVEHRRYRWWNAFHSRFPMVDLASSVADRIWLAEPFPLAQFFCQSLLVLTKSLSEKQWKPRLAPKRLMALDRL